MARLIPALIITFVCFSFILPSSHAESPVTTKEDAVTNLPAATTFNEEDVSDLKPLIVLPTEEALRSDKTDAIPLVNEDSTNFAIEFQDKTEVKPIDDGEKHRPSNWRPINRRFDRMRAFRCRHRPRGPRFGGGAQIWPRMPFPEEHDEEHHRHRHGEIFSGRKFDGPRLHEVDPARFAGVDGDGRTISEFKQPHFFFRGHRHHHHHGHRHGGDEERFGHGDEEMELHHRHGRGHGFWKTVRKFFGHF